MGCSKINKYIKREFSSINESIASKLDIKYIKTTPKNYILELVATTEALLGKGSIEAVILFGSHVYDELTSNSDVDLIIIMNNSISNRKCSITCAVCSLT